MTGEWERFTLSIRGIKKKELLRYAANLSTFLEKNRGKKIIGKDKGCTIPRKVMIRAIQYSFYD